MYIRGTPVIENRRQAHKQGGAIVSYQTINPIKHDFKNISFRIATRPHVDSSVIMALNKTIPDGIPWYMRYLCVVNIHVAFYIDIHKQRR